MTLTVLSGLWSAGMVSLGAAYRSPGELAGLSGKSDGSGIDYEVASLAQSDAPAGCRGRCTRAGERQVGRGGAGPYAAIPARDWGETTGAVRGVNGPRDGPLRRSRQCELGALSWAPSGAAGPTHDAQAGGRPAPGRGHDLGQDRQRDLRRHSGAEVQPGGAVQAAEVDAGVAQPGDEPRGVAPAPHHADVAGPATEHLGERRQQVGVVVV